MITVNTASELRAQITRWRQKGQRIALVPTMGNLHNGHFSLITLARQHADRVVASVFVNPTQFGPREDFSTYPRTLAQDEAGLSANQCDLLFAPAVEEMYPFGSAASVRVEVPGVSEPLEGALRPGHFAGVATVVTKLFNLIQPDIAVFGRKDYQQLLVIERLVEDLRLPIEIIGAPIQREASGLAMSSRNQYLTGEERAHAATIYATLIAMREGILAGQTIPEVERQAQNRLQAAGFEPDYAVVRRAVDLLEPGAGRDSGLIALIAARLGRTRLIDNLPC
jgi:pantoate--beta-alanine ligase